MQCYRVTASLEQSKTADWCRLYRLSPMVAVSFASGDCGDFFDERSHAWGTSGWRAEGFFIRGNEAYSRAGKTTALHVLRMLQDLYRD